MLIAEPGADVGQERLSLVALGVGDDRLQQAVEQAAEQRPRRHAALIAQVVAVDGQVSERERHPPLELGRDPLAQLVDATRVRGFAAAEVVGLAQGHQPWQRLAPDLLDEAPHRAIGPARLVAEHVPAHEVDDGLRLAARDGHPAQQRRRRARRRRCRGR